MSNNEAPRNVRIPLTEAADFVRGQVGCDLQTRDMYSRAEMITILERFAANGRVPIEAGGNARYVWSYDLRDFTIAYKWVVPLNDGLDMLIEFLQAEGAGLREFGKAYSNP